MTTLPSPMEDSTTTAELALAKRIETNPLGWLPGIGDCINITFTPEEAKAAVSALRSTRRDAEAGEVREALELAEDVLSHAPFSTSIWPNGMHPQRGISIIRNALRALGPSSANEVKSSAPASSGSLPSGESDPAVTLDRAGAEARSSSSDPDPVGGWQPIETAPPTEWGKGKHLLVWTDRVVGNVFAADVHHNPDCEVWVNLLNFNGNAVEHWGVTHWKYPPTSPALTEKRPSQEGAK